VSLIVLNPTYDCAKSEFSVELNVFYSEPNSLSIPAVS